MLADVGVTETHSRPHVTDDNPFSEAQFKTLRYQPGFPDPFGDIEDVRAFCADLYNAEHHQAALGLLTPADVHNGLVEQRAAERQAALDAAFATHPERFPRGRPIARKPAREVWINRPAPGSALDIPVAQ